MPSTELKKAFVAIFVLFACANVFFSVLFGNVILIIIAILFALVGAGGIVFLQRENNLITERENERINEAKREERLRTTAEDESRAKTQFLARMSHEIRTPMNAVLGITEIELLKANHPPETEEAFLRIHSASNLLLMVINDILDLSKVEAGKMEIVPIPYEMARLVMDTVLLNLMHIGTKDIHFKLEIDESLPASLIGDELRLKQVLNNFLSNAFKYTTEGTVTFSIGYEDAPDEDDTMLSFSIYDTGQGMSQSQISKLFSSEFTRYNVQANRAVEGTGLGMTIAHQLIIAMNGTVDVRSTPGVGTTFHIKVPQKINGLEMLGFDTAESLRNMKASLPTTKKRTLEIEPMPYGKVLAVDDIESNLFVVEGYLQHYQIQLETVTSGIEAVELIKSGKVYDIIFMDHMMPKMDGLQATKIMREMGYSHPIVALTANTLKGAMELFLSNGFTGFIAKPIDTHQLNAQLIQHIRDKQTPETIEAAKKMKLKADEEHEKLQLTRKLAHSFVRDAGKIVAAIDELLPRQPFNAEDLKTYEVHTHGLKSILLNIERKELSETAAMLETAAQYKDMATIEAQTPILLKKIQTVINELNPASKEDEVHDSDPELLRTQLKLTAAACELYDKKAAYTALKILKNQDWSIETQAVIAEIDSRLLHSEFESTARLINDFIS
jgi:signal transduction histidine kinase/CheY-like chemotaxis protein